MVNLTSVQQAAQDLVNKISYMGASPLDWPEYTALEDALAAGKDEEHSCPDCQDQGLLYECVHCGANNYPKDVAQQFKGRQLIAIEFIADEQIKACIPKPCQKGWIYDEKQVIQAVRAVLQMIREAKHV